MAGEYFCIQPASIFIGHYSGVVRSACIAANDLKLYGWKVEVTRLANSGDKIQISWQSSTF